MSAQSSRGDQPMGGTWVEGFEEGMRVAAVRIAELEATVTRVEEVADDFNTRLRTHLVRRRFAASRIYKALRGPE